MQLGAKRVRNSSGMNQAAFGEVLDDAHSALEEIGYLIGVKSF